MPQKHKLTPNIHLQDTFPLKGHCVTKSKRKGYFYIIDYSDLEDLRLIPAHFKTQEAAWYFLTVDKENYAYKYGVITGSEAIRHGILFRSLRHTDSRSLGKRLARKYQYPDDRMSRFRRKSYRHVQRRLLRKQNGLPPYKKSKKGN